MSVTYSFDGDETVTESDECLCVSSSGADPGCELCGGKGVLDYEHGRHNVNMTNDLARNFFEILGLARRGLTDPCFGTIPESLLAYCLGRLMRFLNVDGARDMYATEDSEEGRYFQMGVSDERLVRQGHALLALFQAARQAGKDVDFA